MPKIMLVDDAEFMRARLQRILAQDGVTLVGAQNGQEALEVYEQEKPDLVLMDITMPVMDGIAALKELKARHPEARVIMCTALGQQSMVIEAIRAGAIDFIVKPFQPERVLAAVAKALG